MLLGRKLKFSTRFTSCRNQTFVNTLYCRNQTFANGSTMLYLPITLNHCPSLGTLFHHVKPHQGRHFVCAFWIRELEILNSQSRRYITVPQYVGLIVSSARYIYIQQTGLLLSRPGSSVYDSNPYTRAATSENHCLVEAHAGCWLLSKRARSATGTFRRPNSSCSVFGDVFKRRAFF